MFSLHWLLSVGTQYTPTSGSKSRVACILAFDMLSRYDVSNVRDGAEAVGLLVLIISAYVSVIRQKLAVFPYLLFIIFS
jgi:hypothetical protein